VAPNHEIGGEYSLTHKKSNVSIVHGSSVHRGHSGVEPEGPQQGRSSPEGEARDRAVPAMGCCLGRLAYFTPPTPEEFLTPQPAAPDPLMTDVPRQLLMNRCDATRAGR
jgi:hypothetical protein